MKTESKPTAGSARNRSPDLAFRASIVNLLCWLLIAIPNFLDTAWSLISLLGIPVTTVIALGAGIWGLLKGKASEREVGRSFFGIIVGGINVILIILSLIGIYGMVNAPF